MDAIARPFGILLMWLYEFTTNYGLAVILFALIVKLLMLPFMMKSKHGMMRVSTLQPHIKELEKKYGGNKLKYQEEVQKLYKEEGVSPTSGCVWSIIPFPILIALYSAIRKPLTIMMGLAADALSDGAPIVQKLTETGFQAASSNAYLQIDQARWISNHFSDFHGLSDKLRNIDYSFLGIDLGTVPNWKLWQFDWNNPKILLPALGMLLVPIVAGVLTWLSSKITAKMNPTGAENNSSMMMMMPLMTLVFAFMMPAALGIYWAASTLFGIFQDVWLTKRYTKVIEAEMAERNAARAKREAELEAKRKETERLRAENATAPNENTSKRRQQIKQKQERAERASEWDRQKSGADDSNDPSRVGPRKYARGRAYDPDRFFAESYESESDEPVVSEVLITEGSAENSATQAIDQAELPKDTDAGFDEDTEEEFYEEPSGEDVSEDK